MVLCRGHRQMKTSYLVAAGLALAATAWIVSGQFGDGERPAGASVAEGAVGSEPEALTAVRVREVTARARTRSITVNGRTEESRRVTLRAETAGPVAETGAEEGRAMKAGDIVVRLDVEDRNARLAEAKALVRQRQIEYRAAAQLAKKGFRADTQLAGARAQLDAAMARTKSMEIDLRRTVIRAPFDGVLETRYVERGDYVRNGDNVASIVDLDPILAVGYVSERNVADIAIGTPGSVRLVDGRRAEGRVRYVASVAEPETRSFRIELEIANPDYGIRAGLTGELNLPLSDIHAHVVSPAVLTLADDGRIGVRIVDGEDRVVFVPVKILADTPQGVWIDGLADGARLITVGHEFVRAGQKVRPVRETAETPS